MNSDPIRVFWVPGCSACVNTKAFLTSLGVPFESVDLPGNKQGAADLAKLGAKLLPVVSRGDKFTFAQSLDQIAEFVGRKRGGVERLPPEELVQRWKEFLAIARSLTAEIPTEKLDYLPIPDRDRTLRDLSYHIFQIPDVFVRNVGGEFEDCAHYVNLPVRDDVISNDDTIRYADVASGSMAGWWGRLKHRNCLWTVKTYYGERPAWELLERQTWHSAQHKRPSRARCFDPRPRVSGRPFSLPSLNSSNVFRSAPARERATSWPRPRWQGRARFDPRPRVSGRRRRILPEIVPARFRSAPARERETSLHAGGAGLEAFRSAPARERATRVCKQERTRTLSFDPRPRVSGRPLPSSMGRPIMKVSIRARA